MFESIFDSMTAGTAVGMATGTVLMCSGVSVLLGLVIAFVYMKSSHYTKNFVITLALMPLLVQAVIMMVNGNLGTSVAVLGAFGLVRFRSLPGTSREILAIFFAMATGLATGMGVLGFAVLLVVMVGTLLLVMSRTAFGGHRSEKELKITIPENLDYNGVFEDIFEAFAKEVSLEQVRTTNMGSMYELLYRIVLKEPDREKEMMDAIRCRNGNLTVLVRRQAQGQGEL